MKLREQGKKQKIISVLLVILWAFLIFFFSNQTGIVSEGKSNFLVYCLNFIVNLVVDIDLTEYEIIFFLVRKLAHMFLYFMLSLLVYYMLYQFKVKKRLVLTLVICFFYAISDEVHQLFIRDRSGQIIDVLIDTIGASLPILYMFFKKSRARLAK